MKSGLLSRSILNSNSDGDLLQAEIKSENGYDVWLGMGTQCTVFIFIFIIIIIFFFIISGNPSEGFSLPARPL